MKKLLVVMLALAVLLSLTGIAFGGDYSSRFSKDRFKKPAGATVKGDINKTIEQTTDASATTGVALSSGNTAYTAVDSTAKSKALGAGSATTNDSAILAENTGDAAATTGGAAVENNVTNEECQTITETAEATVECNFAKVADGNSCDCNNCSCNNNHNNNHNNKCDKCKLCDCCPATVKGDINIDVKQNTTATATSGDANAVGNASSTDVCSVAKALATNGGSADNTSTVVVTNTGTATSASGSASVNNTVNNRVNIDIFRSALTSKSISKFAIW